MIIQSGTERPDDGGRSPWVGVAKPPECERRRPRPWIMAQDWHDLLFAHWPVPIDQLRRVVPAPLVADLYADRAWLGVIAFRLSGIRLRGCPPTPGISAFPEVNLRTYVTLDGRPGVLFLSLHSPNRLAMALARPFRLPYRYAAVDFCRQGGTRIHFASHSPEHANFAAAYRPCSAPEVHAPGELAAWLTERYCYYSVNGSGAVYRCDVEHAQWHLAQAEADIQCNTLAAPFGLQLPDIQPTLAHYAPVMRAHIYGLRRVR